MMAHKNHFEPERVIATPSDLLSYSKLLTFLLS